MTLEAFTEIFFSFNGTGTITVFYDEEACDEYMRQYTHVRDIEILFTIRSTYKTRVWLNERFCKATVAGFCAVNKNEIAVWIDCEEEENDEH